MRDGGVVENNPPPPMAEPPLHKGAFCSYFIPIALCQTRFFCTPSKKQWLSPREIHQKSNCRSFASGNFCFAIKSSRARILTEKGVYALKILHVLSDSNVGGAGILLENLLRHSTLRANTAVVLPRGAAMAARYEALSVRVLPILTCADRSFAPRDLPVLLACLREECPTVVHTHGSLIGRVAATLSGVPVRLATRHCAYPVTGLAACPPMQLIRRAAHGLLSTGTVATAHAAEENLRRLGIPSRSIYMIRNGAEPLPLLGEAEKQETRMALGIPEGCFCIGICARLTPVKGHLVFLSAARILKERGERGLFFLIVGGGEEEGHLREVCTRFGLDACVRFTGYTDAPARYVSLFDVAVNCSTGTETSCLALSEAMSIGTPCVVSRYGGNPEMVREGENGLLFPPRDAAALADCILRLRDDRALYDRLRAGARAAFVREFDARRMASDYDALYQDLTEKGCPLRAPRKRDVKECRG